MAGKCKCSKIKHTWCFQGVAENHSGWSRMNKGERELQGMKLEREPGTRSCWVLWDFGICFTWVLSRGVR